MVRDVEEYLEIGHMRALCGGRTDICGLESLETYCNALMF